MTDARPTPGKLSQAIKFNEIDLAKKLLAEGADPNENDNYGRPALFNAPDSLELIKLLVDNGADVNARNIYPDYDSDVTLLGICIVSGGRLYLKDNVEEHTKILRFLIDKGVELETKDKEGLTPVMQAVRHDNISALNIFIENGVSLHEKDNEGRTALDWAKQENNTEAAEILTNAIELQWQLVVERSAREAEQRRIASLRYTAARKQANLKQHLHKITLRP